MDSPLDAPAHGGDLIVRLLREIAICDERARRHLRSALPPGLSEAQFGVLSHLRYTTNRHERPADLAQLFDVSRPAMTQLVGRMVDAGLVATTPAPDDGRVKHLALTDAGRSCHQDVLDALAPTLDALADRLPRADLTELLDTLQRFRHLLEDVITPATSTRSEEAPST